MRGGWECGEMWWAGGLESVLDGLAAMFSLKPMAALSTACG